VKKKGMMMMIILNNMHGSGTDRSFIHLDARPFKLFFRLSQDTWLILDDERQMREVDAPVNNKDERIAHWLIAAMKEDSNAGNCTLCIGVTQ